MKTLLLGLDAFDPGFFEGMVERGELPHLRDLVEAGKYSRFQVANPPQSEVSWTSIATGLNPGNHGLFDFVHRDPATYSVQVSLLPTEKTLAGIRFTSPHRARTIFDTAVDRGFPATTLWWPATFPARLESPVRSVPGLGTPDLLGMLGVGTLFSADPEDAERGMKTRVAALKKAGAGSYRQGLQGPARQGMFGVRDSSIELILQVHHEGAALKVGDQWIELNTGEWSPILTLAFRMGPLVKVKALTQFILTQTEPHPRLYALPLQIHPLASPWRYGTPGAFIRDLWRSEGPFLTLGWPQDTIALEDGLISDEQFQCLCQSIFESRAAILKKTAREFQEGALGAVLDSLDRIQHIYWDDRPDIVAQWYRRLDRLVGEVLALIGESGGEPARWIILSDHGFTDFDYKVHLNRWLLEHDHLTASDRGEPGTMLESVDWPLTAAYAVGLNGIYLNMVGRERDGTVAPERREERLNEMAAALAAWRGPDGRPVVRRTWRNEEAFEGDLSPYGPDLVVGYAPGYRASQETGLGSWADRPLEANRDRWSADHCVDPEVVPGVIFASRGLENHPRPSYKDIPAMAIEADPDSRGGAPPPALTEEETEIVEERLKSLGYF